MYVCVHVHVFTVFCVACLVNFISAQADLKELLKEFGETIAEKQAEIEKEQDLLAQMQASEILATKVLPAPTCLHLFTARTRRTSLRAPRVISVHTVLLCTAVPFFTVPFFALLLCCSGSPRSGRRGLNPCAYRGSHGQEGDPPSVGCCIDIHVRRYCILNIF